jgi:hypothetical protein
MNEFLSGSKRNFGARSKEFSTVLYIRREEFIQKI